MTVLSVEEYPAWEQYQSDCVDNFRGTPWCSSYSTLYAYIFTAPKQVSFVFFVVLYRVYCVYK